MNHTPTPWAAYKRNDGDWNIHGSVGTIHQIDIAKVSHGLEPNTIEKQKQNAEANAQHIVRCVNAHDALLEALRNAGNVLAGFATGDLKTIKKDSPALVQIRQALTLAEKGE